MESCRKTQYQLNSNYPKGDDRRVKTSRTKQKKSFFCLPNIVHLLASCHMIGFEYRQSRPAYVQPAGGHPFKIVMY